MKESKVSRFFFGGTKVVAFDFCDTLAYQHPKSEAILRKYLKEILGKNISKPQVAAVLGETIYNYQYSSVNIRDQKARRDFYFEFNKRVLKNLGYDDIDPMDMYKYFSNQNRHWLLKTGVKKFLKVLKEKNFFLLIASNFDSNLNSLLINLGVIDFFDRIFVSAELNLEKPHIRFYEHIRDTLNCEAGEIAMIGDNLELDVYPAIQAGFKGFHLNMCASRPNRLVHIRCGLELEFFEIPDLRSLIID